MPLLTIAFPVFNPVVFAIGPFVVRWYALAYICCILLGWIYARAMIKTEKLWNGPAPVTLPQLDDFVLWVTIGIFVGGRPGYGKVYNPKILRPQRAELLD